MIDLKLWLSFAVGYVASRWALLRMGHITDDLVISGIVAALVTLALACGLKVLAWAVKRAFARFYPSTAS